MKKALRLSMILAALLLLWGCSNDTEDAPTGTTAPETKISEFWTVIDGATWTDDFNGLKTTIKHVVVSDKVPMTDGSVKSMVGIKFNIENTTKDTFTTYPNQATLVTSTGEQIEADMSLSGNLGGEIFDGVTKEGNVDFVLKNGQAESIKWIRLMWLTHPGKSTEITQDNQKHYDIKIEF